MKFSIPVPHPMTNLIISGHLDREEITVSHIIIGSAADVCMKTVSQQLAYHRSVASMVRRFIEYLDCISDGLPEVKIYYGKMTPFQSAVVAAARTVSCGSTCSYSDLAVKAGFPHAVRAVASVMRNNRIPLLIPCHRIVKKNGKTGAYCGDVHGPDALLKRRLLQLEHELLEKNHISLSIPCA